MATTTSTPEAILDAVGGAENIIHFTHCATRLRFELKDASGIDKAAVEAIPGVMGAVPQSGDRYQIVIGGAVQSVYDEINNLPAMKSRGGSSGSDQSDADVKAAARAKARGKNAYVDAFFEYLSDSFRPLLPVLLGASLIIAGLAVLDSFGVINASDPTLTATDKPAAQVFAEAMFKSVFHFLPIMVAYNAAKKLNIDPWVGAAVMAALMTPPFLDLSKALGTTCTHNATLNKDLCVAHIAGVPMQLNDYSGQVFVPLMMVAILALVYKGLVKVVPTNVQMVFVPFLSFVIMMPVTAFLIGPLGIWIGTGLGTALFWLNSHAPIIFAILIPMVYPFLVPLGLHWPLNAIMIQNIATYEQDVIQGPMGSWNFACFGVITGVLILSIKERNKSMQQVALGGTMAGLLGGISEPSLYGVLLRFKKSYARLLPGCLAGGFVAGFFSIKAHAFVFTSLLTIPAMDPMLGYALSIAVAFGTSLTLVLMFDYRTPEEKAEALAKIAAEHGEAAPPAVAPAADDAPVAAVSEAPADGGGVATLTKPVKTALQSGAVTEITSPLEGEAVALKDVPDPIFAGAKLGKGVAIKPSGDTVFAPADATVLAVQKSGHAVGLRLDSGVELLVHVGIDTVQLGGEGFTVHVEAKQHVTAGTPLITFDTKFIESKGYNMITPVLVSNTKKFAEVEGFPAAHADTDTVVVKTTAKTAE